MNNKLKVLVSVLVMSFVMVGCGGDDEGVASAPSVDNAPLASGENQYGYFGEGILFAGFKITGSWQVFNFKTNSSFGVINFYADGDGELNTGTIYDIDYGVSLDGKTINIGGDYSTTLIVREIDKDALSTSTNNGPVTTYDCIKVDSISGDALSMCPNILPQ